MQPLRSNSFSLLLSFFLCTYIITLFLYWQSIWYWRQGRLWTLNSPSGLPLQAELTHPDDTLLYIYIYIYICIQITQERKFQRWVNEKGWKEERKRNYSILKKKTKFKHYPCFLPIGMMVTVNYQLDKRYSWYKNNLGKETGCAWMSLSQLHSAETLLTIGDKIP